MATAKSVSREMGKMIRELREEEQLSQADLAERLGIHPQVISDVERGEKGITVDRLFRFLDALGYEADIRLTELKDPTRVAWGRIKADDPQRRHEIRMGRIIAEAVADHLYDRYDPSRAAVFGSLVEDQGSQFDEYSDIDFLVKGLDPERRFRAETTIEMEVLPELVDEEDRNYSIDIVREEVFGESIESLIGDEKAIEIPPRKNGDS
jgi:transcriptional regulator with XRE-family HTH domain